MDTFFDSFLEEYKTPFGAVRSGTPVTFHLTVPEHLGYVNPHLVITKDGKGQQPVFRQMEFEGKTAEVKRYCITLTLEQPSLYFYHFDLYTDFRRIYRNEDGKGVLSWEDGQEWQLTVYEKDFETPERFKGKVFYQIFPDRFYEGVKNKEMPYADRIYRADKNGEPYFGTADNTANGAINIDYFGGDFAGIQQKLGYLKELGVDYIYLNPIFEAHSNHRYNTADYMNVDPVLGTNEDFTALCKAAAEKGMGIILDGVFSHTGSDSIYFNREGRYGAGGAYHDPYSPYRTWYDFSDRYKCGYRSWWGFDTLPEVEEENPSYVKFITGVGGVVDTWLQRGASGFRLDVADELPDDFIEELRKAVKRNGEDKLLIGEVWEDATTKVAYDLRRTYLLGKGLDSVMNYPFRNAVLDYIKGESAEITARRILSICENYPQPALDVALNFLSTHDTERALTYIADKPGTGHDRNWQSGRRIPHTRYDRAVEQLIMAYALIFMLPGMPCIYYGDEIAMQGYRDPFNRAYFDWNSREYRIKAVIQQMSEFRAKSAALRSGKLELVKAEGGVLHFRRVTPEETVDCIFNRTNHLLVTEVYGKSQLVNPMGFTIVSEEPGHNMNNSYFDIQ